MAAKSKERVYRMKLDQFHRYLGDKRRELEACYKEIEEIQFQFNDIFARELAAWQEKFAYCYPRVAAQRQELPAAFAQLIDSVEEEERARIKAEIADLEREIREGRAGLDDLLGESQATTSALRADNPGLNDREESLKAKMVELQDEYARAYEEMEGLDAFPLGWLTNFFVIRRLKKVQKKAKKKQAGTLEELRRVRQDWLDKVEAAGDTQAAIREEWQEASVRVSEAQGRRDHLVANCEALAEQAALQRVLEELKEPPEVPGELGAALSELVERNHVRWRYEEGLQAVAEALGLTKGVGEGLKRFQRSVSTVLQEQRRYGLKAVSVLVPHSVAVLNATWEGLSKKVKDEEYMGKHPLEFSRVIDKYIKARLTDEDIQGLFEVMGAALNQATSAWN